MVQSSDKCGDVALQIKLDLANKLRSNSHNRGLSLSDPIYCRFASMLGPNSKDLKSLSFLSLLMDGSTKLPCQCPAISVQPNISEPKKKIPTFKKSKKHARGQKINKSNKILTASKQEMRRLIKNKYVKYKKDVYVRYMGRNYRNEPPETATIPDDVPEVVVEAARIPKDVHEESEKSEDSKNNNTCLEGDSDYEIIYENTQIKRAIDSITNFDEEYKNQCESQDLKRSKYDLGSSIQKSWKIPKKSKQLKSPNNQNLDTETMEAASTLERILNGEINNGEVNNKESCNEQRGVSFPEMDKLCQPKRITKIKKENQDEKESTCDLSVQSVQPQKLLNRVDVTIKHSKHLLPRNETKKPTAANPNSQSSRWYKLSKITIKLPNLEKKPGPLYGLKPTIATNLGVDLSFLTDEFVNDALKMMGNESKTSKLQPEDLSNIEDLADNEPGSK